MSDKCGNLLAMGWAAIVLSAFFLCLVGCTGQDPEVLEATKLLGKSYDKAHSAFAKLGPRGIPSLVATLEDADPKKATDAMLVLDVLSSDPNGCYYAALPTLIRIANRFPHAEMTKEFWDRDYAQTMEERSVLARAVIVHMLNPDSWEWEGGSGGIPRFTDAFLKVAAYHKRVHEWYDEWRCKLTPERR